MLTQLIEKVILKVATVEQIHAEFDSGEERILSECDKILSELQIPTETQIEKKAYIMKELGFVNSETVKQAEKLQQNSKKIERKINITAKQAETIRYFKQKYPFEKFITVDELERICNKYNLIHAPVANYIKDIPEKNVLEMRNCRKLEIGDFQELQITIKVRDTDQDGLKAVNRYLNKYENNQTFTLSECQKLHNFWVCYIGRKGDYLYPFDYLSLKSQNAWFAQSTNKLIGNYCHYDEAEIIDKSGLFIAAPKSHFNLKELNKKSKFGFFRVETFEVKDPVVFEYCKGNIIRIISKWGNSNEDKAYLDPILQNEKLN